MCLLHVENDPISQGNFSTNIYNALANWSEHIVPAHLAVSAEWTFRRQVVQFADGFFVWWRNGWHQFYHALRRPLGHFIGIVSY